MTTQIEKNAMLAARGARIKELTEQDLSAAEIAKIVGISPRRVTSWRSRLGIAERKTPLVTEEEENRIKVLRAEGMPATWIREDVPRSIHRINAAAPMGKEASREWLQAWQHIRRNPELLALHYEFAPPTPGLAARDRASMAEGVES